MSVAEITGQFALATVIGSLPSAGGNSMQVLLEALANPSLNFIPIYADSVECTREADISTSMIMSQSEGKKQFVTDNVSPRPRVWTMHGYLRSLIPYLEGTLFFKPTILLQKIVLDYSMMTRKAVFFKTTDGEIVEVLIKTVKITSTPKNQSHAEVNVTVQELNYLVAEEGSLDEMSASATASISPLALASIGAAVAVAAVAAIPGVL